MSINASKLVKSTVRPSWRQGAGLGEPVRPATPRTLPAVQNARFFAFQLAKWVCWSVLCTQNGWKHGCIATTRNEDYSP